MKNPFIEMISGLCVVGDVMACANERVAAVARSLNRKVHRKQRDLTPAERKAFHLLDQLREAQVAWWGDRPRSAEFPRGTPFDQAIDRLVFRVK